MFMISSEETYQDGQIIFKQGAAGDWIYQVISGQVEIVKQVGDREMIIETIGPEEVFGELSFISKSPRSATVRALGQTTVGIIDRSFLDEEYNKLSGDFRLILQALTRRLRTTTDMALTAQVARRQEARTRKALNLAFKSRSGLVNAFSEDISIGGMFIRTPAPLALDEIFNLRLQLPGADKPMEIGCRVCWSRPEAQAQKQGLLPGMGVKFIDIAEDDHRRLRQELKGLLAAQAKP